MAKELIKRRTSLSANLIGFCRYLRQKGYTIGPSEEMEALRAIEVLQPYQEPSQFRLCLKTVLSRNLYQLQQFDEHYFQYWKELERAINSKYVDSESESNGQNRKQPNQQPSLQALKSWLYGKETEEETELTTYSAQEVLTKKDFAGFSDEELWEVARLIRAIARSMALKMERLRRKTKQVAALDLRRTLRLNLRRGGELIELAYQKPQKQRQQIVLICDVSKSMDLYSRFLVQFIYAFQNAYRRIETFVFSTSLHRVSRQLRQRHLNAALRELAEHVPDWSGGTRIGESMATFCENFASRLLNKQTIVLIMSDGWDTGDANLLAESMRHIHKRAGKVIWLNPLAGNPRFSPSVKGMEAAMPYIDVFAAAHNVESLRAVARHLR